MRGLWVLCRPCLEQERVIRVGEGLERILDDGELPREGRPLVRVPVSGQSAVAPPDGRRVARAAREEERVREAGAPRGDLRQDRPLATASRGGSRGFGAFLRPSVERGTGGRRPSEPRPTRPRLDGGPRASAATARCARPTRAEARSASSSPPARSAGAPGARAKAASIHRTPPDAS